MIWLRGGYFSSFLMICKGRYFMKLLDEYILFIDEKINKDERLFLDLKTYSSHIDEESSIEEQKLSLCSELLSFGENILSFYNEENISSSFKKLITEHKY